MDIQRSLVEGLWVFMWKYTCLKIRYSVYEKGRFVFIAKSWLFKKWRRKMQFRPTLNLRRIFLYLAKLQNRLVHSKSCIIKIIPNTPGSVYSIRDYFACRETDRQIIYCLLIFIKKNLFVFWIISYFLIISRFFSVNWRL